MAAVAAVGVAAGRPASTLRTLALGVTAMVLVDPLLTTSLGFRLSVLGAGGIVVGAGRLERRLPGPRWLAAPLAVTVSAQAAVSPLLVATFGACRWPRSPPTSCRPRRRPDHGVGSHGRAGGGCRRRAGGAPPPPAHRGPAGVARRRGHRGRALAAGRPPGVAPRVPRAGGGAGDDRAALGRAARRHRPADTGRAAGADGATPVVARPAIGGAPGGLQPGVAVAAATLASATASLRAGPDLAGAAAGGRRRGPAGRGSRRRGGRRPGADPAAVLEGLRRARVHSLRVIVVRTASHGALDVVVLLRQRWRGSAVLVPRSGQAPAAARSALAGAYVPAPGTTVALGGVRLRVTEVTERLVVDLHLARAPPPVGRGSNRPGPAARDLSSALVPSPARRRPARSTSRRREGRRSGPTTACWSRGSCRHPASGARSRPRHEPRRRRRRPRRCLARTSPDRPGRAGRARAGGRHRDLARRGGRRRPGRGRAGPPPAVRPRGATEAEMRVVTVPLAAVVTDPVRCGGPGPRWRGGWPWRSTPPACPRAMHSPPSRWPSPTDAG